MSAAASATSATAIDRILRKPRALASDCVDERLEPSVIATAIATIVGGAALFGGVLGALRGGRQIAYAAMKMPLAMLVTLIVAIPAFHALSAVFGRPRTLRVAVSLALTAAARTSLVLVAATPSLWLFVDLGAETASVKLAATLAYALAGLAGLVVLLAGIGRGPGGARTALTFGVVFLLAGAQSAYALRPYLIGRGGRAVTFLAHDREGGLLNELERAASEVFVREGARSEPRR